MIFRLLCYVIRITCWNLITVRFGPSEPALLGYSPTAQYYAISGMDEAKEYISHPVLGEQLREISSASLGWRGLRPASKIDAGHILESSDAEEVMGWPDNLKLRSSMTLFSVAAPGCDVFQKVLNKYFSGEKDAKTIAILGWQNPSVICP